ncbi:MAG: hypothetical protein LC777_11615 [Actinobacteria bacterium]|nr:hypothetical protein [Actinomycetota bacterium]
MGLRDPHRLSAWSGVEDPVLWAAPTGEFSCDPLAAVRDMLTGVSVDARASYFARRVDTVGAYPLQEGIGRALLREAVQSALRVATANRPDGVVDEGAPC